MFCNHDTFMINYNGLKLRMICTETGEKKLYGNMTIFAKKRQGVLIVNGKWLIVNENLCES